MASTLPDDLIELLAETYGEVNPATGKRWTLRQLAGLATTKLGRPVTRPVVERAIAPVRAEWARVAREVARERIGTKLPAQLDALDDMIEAEKLDFIEAESAKERAAALEAYHRGLALKLRYSGIGEVVELSGDVTIDGNLADARSQLAAQLTRAASGALAAGAAAGAGRALPGSGRDPSS